MANNGVYWFTDPGKLAQKFSAYSKEIDTITEEVVDRSLNSAVKIMQRAVMTRGVKDKMPTGGPRVKTWAMYNSIGKKMFRNNRGRVQGEWGFINNPPKHVRYQELGTKRGILAMHAFADSQTILVDEIDNNFRGANLWRNF